MSGPTRQRPHVGLRLELAAGLLLILVPILGLLLGEYNDATARRRRLVMDSLAQTAEAVAVATDATFDEAIAVGWAIAAETAVQSLDPAQVRLQLQRLAPVYSQYANLAVFDVDGRLIAESAPDPDLARNISDRDYFQRVLDTGQPTTIEVVLSQRSGRPATGVAVPIFGNDGAPQGVVAIAFDLDRLGRRLEQVGLRPGQDITLIDYTGHLAHAASERVADTPIPWPQRDLSALPEVRAALAGRTVRVPEMRLAGISDTDATVAAVFVPTHKYSWIVNVTWPVAAAFGPVEESHRQQLAGFGVVTLLALGGTVLLSHFVTEPLRRVIAQARALGAGKLDQRVDIRTFDELAQLGETFNTMAEQIQSAQSALVVARAAAEAQQAEAEQARRDLQRFLGFIAHDLRTPIAAVKASAGVLLTYVPPDFPQPLQEMLEGVDVAADRMAKLANDLLDAARIGAGRLTVRPRRVDLAAIARRAVEQQRVVTPGREIALEVPDPPETLAGTWDPDRLEQVLANLVGNAVKYSDAASPVRVRVFRTDGEARVAVADRGRGIEPDEIALLFRPFSRLPDTAGATDTGGTGLGLYICQGIVQAHGGRIWVESEGPGHGVTVTFTLPLGAGADGGEGERGSRDDSPAAQAAAQAAEAVA